MTSPTEQPFLIALQAFRLGMVSAEDLKEALDAWGGQQEKSLQQVLFEISQLPPGTQQELRALVEQAHPSTSTALQANFSTLVPDPRLSQQHAHDDDPPGTAEFVGGPEVELSGGAQDQNVAPEGRAREPLELDTLASMEPSDAPSVSEAKPVDAETMEFDERLSGAAIGIESSVGQSHAENGRFRLLEPLEGGEGGMGRIHLAEDAELGRQVALKQIRSERADEEFHRQKFRLEAEITGNLEHPGIVPIYGLGADPSGRPFYAMRLVSGQDFGEEISRFHRDRKDGLASYDSVEFRALIDRLIAVAQAIDYAHSRGVLHRDIKPNNVMVGKFGETLVIDWGLARVPHQDVGFDEAASAQANAEYDPSKPDKSVAHGGKSEDAQHSTPLRVRSGDSASKTMQGSVMGTLGYAAPEQLRGDQVAVGVRSDLYGLGAVLYEILTGTTTIELNNRKRDDVVADVLAGRIAPPQKLVNAVPKPLAAICSKALAQSPEDRYCSARDLVDELERWKADQPVRARRESLIERTARFARKHRSAAISTTLALAVIALVSTVALVEVNRQRKLASDSAISEKEQRLEADKARKAAENSAAAERLAKQEATELAARNQKVVDVFVASFEIPNITDFATSDSELNSGDMTAVQVLEQALDNLDAEDSLSKDEKSKAALLFAIGRSLRSVGKLEKAEQSLQQSLELHQRLFGESHKDTLQVQLELAHVHSRLGDTETALQFAERARAVAEAEYGPQHRETLIAWGYVADIHREHGKHQEAIELYEELVPAIKEALGEESPDTLTAEAGLALTYVLVGREAEAIAVMERCLPIQKRVYGPRHPKTVLAMTTLANSYSQSARVQESIPLFLEAAEIMEDRLGKDHPSTALSRANIANGYFFLGDYARALPYLEQAYQDLKKILGQDHPQVLTLMNNLAMCFQGVGRLDEAESLFEENLELRKNSFGEHHIDTIGSLITVALPYMQRGQAAKALERLEEAEQLLLQHYSDQHVYLIQVWGIGARGHLATGAIDKAIEWTRKSVDLCIRLQGEKDPNTLMSMETLASVLRIAGRLDEAKETIAKVYSERKSLFGPDNHTTLMAQSELSAVELMLGNQDQALKHANEVVAGYVRRKDPENPVALRTQIYAATIYQKRREYEQAVAIFKRALKAIPMCYGEHSETTYSAYVGLGFALCGTGKEAEAMQYFQTVAAAEEPLAANLIVARALDGWQNLLRKQRQFAEAKPIIERWIEHPVVQGRADPEMALNAHIAMAWVLVELEEYDDATGQLDAIEEELQQNELALALAESCRGVVLDAEGEADQARELLEQSAEALMGSRDSFESYRSWQMTRAVERLADFLEKQNLSDEAKLWRKRLKTLAR